MGGQEDAIIRAAIERNEPIPVGIIDRPEVWPINDAPWRCFWALNRSRGMIALGMTATHAGLAYESISQWARDHGEADDLDEFDLFVFLVQRMDEEWLKLNRKTK